MELRDTAMHCDTVAVRVRHLRRRVRLCKRVRARVRVW